MKKLILALAILTAPALALAGTLAMSVSVDQDTVMYLGSDLTNYVLIPSGTYRDAHIVSSKSQVVFAQTSSARTLAPNIRIEFMNSTAGMPELSKDGVGVKIQSIRTDSIGNYWLTKRTTIPLN